MHSVITIGSLVHTMVIYTILVCTEITHKRGCYDTIDCNNLQKETNQNTNRQ